MLAWNRTALFAGLAVLAGLPAYHLVRMAPGFSLPPPAGAQTVQLRARIDRDARQLAAGKAANAKLSAAIAKIEGQIALMEKNYTSHMTKLAKEGRIQLSGGTGSSGGEDSDGGSEGGDGAESGADGS